MKTSFNTYEKLSDEKIKLGADSAVGLDTISAQIVRSMTGKP